jgi:colicin import membrane protein
MQMDKTFSWPIVFSVGLHTLLLVLILGNWEFLSFKKDEVPPPQFVTATLMDMKPKARAQPQQLREQELEAKRIEDMRDRKRQEDQRKQAAQAAEVKKQEQAARATEQEKVKQEKIKQELAKQQTAKAEQQKKLAEEKQKKLAEEQARKAAAQKKAQQEREAQEEKRKVEAARQELAKHVSESIDDVDENVKSYGQAIVERIEQNWSRPASARNGMVAIIEISMLPTGVVTGLRVVKGSGDALFDAAAERAIRQVDRFTEVMQIPPAIFEAHYRTFQLTFTPEDLRQ